MNNIHSRPYILSLLIALMLTVTACASDQTKETKALELIKDRPVEELYNRAANMLDAGEYKKAAKAFTFVDTQYPYSEWATRAQLMASYAQYKDLQYPEAIAGLDRYIQLFPGSDDIAYAYYLRALSHYEQIVDVRRDQGTTVDAMEAFDAVIERFPNTSYARDAALKRDLTLDHLAGKEMTVGRYYQKQGIFSAALKRYLNVIKEYQTTTQTPEALFRMVESYHALGLDAESARAAAILGYNFPGSEWYDRAYALLKPEYKAEIDKEIRDNKGLVSRTIDSLF